MHRRWRNGRLRTLTAELKRVWQWLRPRRSASADELMLRSGLGLGEVLSALAELEELGRAEQLLDGWRRADR